jgi:succinoglycan biosynthesis protein ExoA
MNAGDTLQLTIIVACRNEKSHIRRFIDSLLAQDMSGMAWEAIIADGMSDDGTREILRE